MNTHSRATTSLLILLFSINSVSAQNNPLEIFNHLVGKTWKAEGNWENGGIFKQESDFKYELDRQLIIVRTRGFIDEKQSAYGQRNFGIRSYDQATNQVSFIEYDIFGGETKGSVRKEGDRIIYEYEYLGYNFEDVWEYVNDSLYNFTVHSYTKNKRKEIHLKTQFKRIN